MFLFRRVNWITRTLTFVWVGLDSICCWTISTNWEQCEMVKSRIKEKLLIFIHNWCERKVFWSYNNGRVWLLWFNLIMHYSYHSKAIFLLTIKNEWGWTIKYLISGDYKVVCVQLNKYETAPNFIQLSRNVTWNCLLVSVYLPVFTSFCMMWSWNCSADQNKTILWSHHVKTGKNR